MCVWLAEAVEDRQRPGRATIYRARVRLDGGVAIADRDPVHARRSWCRGAATVRSAGVAREAAVASLCDEVLGDEASQGSPVRVRVVCRARHGSDVDGAGRSGR